MTIKNIYFESRKHDSLEHGRKEADGYDAFHLGSRAAAI
jgi:hypothetical protein